LKVKGILIDLDGTIVDSKQAYAEAAKIAFETMGQETFDTKLVTEIPKRLEQNLSVNDILNGIDPQKFLDTYRKAYYQITGAKTMLIPNIASTIRKLSEKTILALITMRYVPKKQIIEELEKFGLAKYFQYITTALETRNPKPSPEALIKCAKNFGIQTHECIIVGDSIADIKAGKAAGAKTVAVLSGIFSREELKREHPDLILENINQLPDFLESLEN
jgi:phosphoglycolate phosphatase/pyrophosphatase PpaX